MPLSALHHITVQTDDLEATRDFYRDVLGLKVGFRPDLDFPGYWLYCRDVPVVHLVPRVTRSAAVRRRIRGLSITSRSWRPIFRASVDARQQRRQVS
jgi:extradiol dioxygenase family protein